MRIITWNINSIRLRLGLLKQISDKLHPDIIALQETKVSNELFPLQSIQEMGFKHVVFSGQKSYNGVAILSKFPIANSFSLQFYNDDKRHICAHINGTEIHNFYVPAGGDVPDTELNPKFRHKIEFVRLMKEWFINNRCKKQDQIILLGDLNIAPHEHDVWSSRQLRYVVSHTNIERKALIEMQMSFDFIDTGRHFTDLNTKLYSWWSYRNRDWKKSNRGRRLDHIWVSQNLKHSLASTHYDLESRDAISPSDHIPCLVELR